MTCWSVGWLTPLMGTLAYMIANALPQAIMPSSLAVCPSLTRNLPRGGGLLFLLGGRVGFDLLLCRLLLHGLRRLVAHNRFAFL